MRKTSVSIWSFITRARYAVIGAVFGLSLSFAGILAVLPLTTASTLAASACPQNNTPQFNIIYCGLSGPTDAEYISSLQGYYNNNSDGHGNSDILTVLNWAGASSSMIAGMNTSNTVLGTAFSNGTITVNGQTVGTNSIVSARWNPGGPGFTHLEGNVWYRNATTSFAPTPSVQVLVHLNSSGQADFAVMTVCGNVLKFTPTPPPKKVLTCDELTQSEVDSTLEFAFTAKATAQNTAITSYTFFFGDGTSQIVDTAASSTSTDHTYNLNATTYDAKVLVNGNVTSANCMVELTTPPPPVKPMLTCIELTQMLADNSTTEYNFTAQADAQNTSIDSYSFNFGDKTITTIPTDAKSINVSHTYAPGTYMARVTVNGENNKLHATSAACTANITVAVTPPTTPPPATPPVTTMLVNTGPGSIVAIFAGATIIGTIFHNVIRRRFLPSK